MKALLCCFRKIIKRAICYTNNILLLPIHEKTSFFFTPHYISCFIRRRWREIKYLIGTKKVSGVPLTLRRELMMSVPIKNLVHDFLFMSLYGILRVSFPPLFSLFRSAPHPTPPCYSWRGRRMGGWLGTTSQELFPFPPTGDAIWGRGKGGGTLRWGVGKTSNFC